MQAERVILTTDAEGKLSPLPKLPPNARVEAIFIVLDANAEGGALRRPHPDIAGKARVLGDIFDSAAPSDWHEPA